MNKTISVNIGGFVFNIEEEAYQKLYQYLAAVKKNVGNSEDRAEIMNDIEQRIAELFKYRNVHKEVVIDKDIEYIIETMGKPEDYALAGFDTPPSAADPISERQEGGIGPKRLFRDTENAVLGGVCSGLSHYLNLDVSIIRILLILFTIGFGMGVFMYIVMYFIVPEARTTADKLLMKGQPVTVGNIKDYFINLKKEVGAHAPGLRLSKLFDGAVNKSASLLSILVKLSLAILALTLLVGGLFVLPIIFTVFFGNNGLLPLTDSAESIGLFSLISLIGPTYGFGYIVFIALILLALLPVVGIVMVSVKILFKMKASLKVAGVIMTALWLMSLSYVVITGINLGMNFRSHAELEYKVPCKDSINELAIDVVEDPKFSSGISYDDVWNHSEFILLERDRVLLGYPKLEIIEKADTSGFELTIYRRSHGLSTREAVRKADGVSYEVDLVGNRLMLSPYFSFSRADKFRNQLVVVEVRVPKGKKITLGKKIDRIDVSLRGSHRRHHQSLAYTSWLATDDRLVCQKCR